MFAKALPLIASLLVAALTGCSAIAPKTTTNDAKIPQCTQNGNNCQLPEPITGKSGGTGG